MGNLCDGSSRTFNEASGQKLVRRPTATIEGVPDSVTKATVEGELVLDALSEVAQVVPPGQPAKVPKQKVDCLPFYSIETSVFERLISKAAGESKTITLAQFKSIFLNMPGWESHFENGTPLLKLLRDPYLYPNKQQNPQDISVERLLLIGILLCKGNARTRAEVLWKVVQEGPTPYLSASDKDFYPAFQDMVEIGIFILADFARNLERNDYLVKNLKVENVYRLHEDFIDAIYGLESHTAKEQWLEKVSEAVQWILKPETMRDRLWDLLHKPKQDQVYDAPDFPLTKRWTTKLGGVAQQ